MKLSGFSARVLAGALVFGAPLLVRAVADDAKPAAPARPAAASAAGNPLAGLKNAVDELKLTGDTKAKVDEILAKAQDEAAEAVKSASGDRRAAFRKVAEITKNTGDQIIALLDVDQKLMLRSKLQTAAPRPGADAAPGAAAPGAGGPAARGAFVMQRMKDVTATLSLTDEQSKRVDDVIADLTKKLQDLRAAGPSPETREKLMTLREDAVKQLKEILTEEQFTKFQTAMQQGPAGGAAGGRLAGFVQRFQDAIKDLDLSAEQKTKVETAMTDARKKFAELAPQLQGGQPTPELREKVRSAMDDLRTQLMDILTPSSRRSSAPRCKMPAAPAVEAAQDAPVPAQTPPSPRRSKRLIG